MHKVIMQFPKGKSKAVTLSYDDGMEQDIKLVSLMRKYGLKGTFNLNSGLFEPDEAKLPEGMIYRRISKNNAVSLYCCPDLEIAGHGTQHLHINDLCRPEHFYKEIFLNKKNLEKIFHIPVRGYAYPYGEYNEKIIDALKKYHILYARTTKSTYEFKLPDDWLLWNPTCRHRDDHLFELVHTFINSDDEEPQLFYLWGHSFEFDEDDNWERFERFAKAVRGGGKTRCMVCDK